MMPFHRICTQRIFKGTNSAPSPLKERMFSFQIKKRLDVPLDSECYVSEDVLVLEINHPKRVKVRVHSGYNQFLQYQYQFLVLRTRVRIAFAIAIVGYKKEKCET
jgi:hypothetical protein